MQEENNINNAVAEEKEIDFLELATKLWAHRRTVAKWCAWGAVIGLVVAFSIPKEYAVGVKLAPEITGAKSNSGLASLAANFLGTSAGTAGITDAVYPQLYPDVVSSVPFVTSLFDVEVTTKEDGRKTTVRQFMEDDTSSPWWSVILGLPGKAIGAVVDLFKDEEEVGEDHKVDSFRLTKDESLLVESINKRVSASVDQKTMVVSLSVKMQDPLVAALLADTVTARLQKFITDYRTNKARNDLEYAERLNEKAKNKYFEAQQRLADYMDRNQNLALFSAQTMRDRLQNEASLAFTIYNQTEQQVQLALAKVQENTPVYAVVSPATVPVKATSPKKLMILVGFTFLAFAAYAAWLLFLQPMLEDYKTKTRAAAQSESKE